jgi:hypothetical protein
VNVIEHLSDATFFGNAHEFLIVQHVCESCRFALIEILLLLVGPTVNVNAATEMDLLWCVAMSASDARAVTVGVETKSIRVKSLHHAPLSIVDRRGMYVIFQRGV